MAKGFGGPDQAQFFSPGTGAGGYYGQANPSNVGPLDQMTKSMGVLNEGIGAFVDSRISRDKMAMEKEKFAQDMQIQQAKLGMAKEENQLQTMKFASMQKQQEFDNQIKMKQESRLQLKSQLEMADWQNKEAVAEMMRNNIGAVTDILSTGKVEDLLSSDEYKTVLAGLATVDPEGTVKQINDLYSKVAKEQQNKTAAATYHMTEEIYINELPNAMAAIDSGKSIAEAMEPIRLKISSLYKSGNIDHKAVTEQLKGMMSLISQYKSKKSPSALVSFDEQGNQVDPMMNPAGIVRQVDAKTGKVTTVGGNKKEDAFAKIQKLQEMQKKSKGK
jgi:hypothetical protein